MIPPTARKRSLSAAQAGLVGGSIEDATGRADDPIYPFALAVERVAAAVQAARALPFPFVLTARAENFINGRPDLADTLRRLEAFCGGRGRRALRAGTQVARRHSKPS